MEQDKFEEWRIGVNKVFYSQIILDRLKESKKISRKKYLEIRNKIKRMRYKSHINSPMFENKPELKKNVIISCIKDYINSHKSSQEKNK